MKNEEAASILEQMIKNFKPSRCNGKTMSALRTQVALSQAIHVLRATPEPDNPYLEEFKRAGFDEEQCKELYEFCFKYNIAPQALIAVVYTYYPGRKSNTLEELGVDER